MAEAALRALLPAFWEKRGAVHPAGVFVGAPDRNWVALRMDVARFREGDETWDNPYLVVFHEYVHLVLRLNFESLPLWLNEGLAEFWGSTIIESDRVYEGRPVPYHVQTLRQRTPLSLAALFAVKEGSPEYSEENRAGIFYAESWALVHYLALGSDGRRGQINRLAVAGLVKAVVFGFVAAAAGCFRGLHGGTSPAAVGRTVRKAVVSAVVAVALADRFLTFVFKWVRL